ncbi:MAG TPA: YdeI/OmpD-associated family protein [Solirubrobacteraceae bacterium]|nr:YdeI/OmpD-associated family protein [Solirubrobacteraceae bacterium]
MPEELAELIVADAAAWRKWLEGRHGESPGVWLVLAKKHATTPTTLRYDEALEHALCFGWIDGQVRRRDAGSYRQRFTPRRARSAWSRRNTELAERLIAAGGMHPAGLAAIEAARADGRWGAAYTSPANSTVPPDLAAALAGEPAAQATFEGLDGQNRYAILYRLQTARRAETRARRIEGFVEMLARGETPHPRRGD